MRWAHSSGSPTIQMFSIIYVDGEFVVGHIGVDFGGLDEAGAESVGELVLEVVAAQDFVGALSRQVAGFGDEDIASDTPLGAAGVAAGFGGGVRDGGPVVGEVPGGEVAAAHGDPAFASGDADAAAADGGGGHADGGMRLLEGFHMEAAFQDGVQFGGVDGEEFALVGELAIGCPESEDDVEDFGGAAADGFAFAGIHAEEGEVGGDGAVSDAPVEAAAGQVVEHGQAVGEFDGVVDGEEGDAGGEADVFGEGGGFGDEEVGEGRVFPALGEVFADPGFVEAEAVGGLEQVQVAVVGVGVGAVRGVEGHHKEAELHGGVTPSATGAGVAGARRAGRSDGGARVLAGGGGVNRDTPGGFGRRGAYLMI